MNCNSKLGCCDVIERCCVGCGEPMQGNCHSENCVFCEIK